MSETTSTIPLIQDTERLEKRLKEIPAEPGVYLMRGHDDLILYIGKSKKLRSRVRSYFRDTQYHSPRIEKMVQKIREIEFIVTDTESEALALEANLIKQHQPNFNVLLKDDKKYPYLCITWSEEYPRIFITRKRQIGKNKDRYYGPYVDSQALRHSLELIKRNFPLRQRPQPLFKDRPCLNYDIGRCPGVCQQLITPAAYREIVQQVAMFFQGRTAELVKILTEKMAKEADALNFEQAAIIRDQISSLNTLRAEQKVSLTDDTISRDAMALATNEKDACIQLFQIREGKLVGRLGFFAALTNLEHLTNQAKNMELGTILQTALESHYQNVDSWEIPSEILVQYDLPEPEILINWLSEKKGKKVTIITPQRQSKADFIEMVERNAKHELTNLEKIGNRHQQSLQNLAEILDLPDIPKHIEGYDISHIQGADAVASRVVFINGIPAKQNYRHYHIKNPAIHAGHSDDFASMAEVIKRRFTDVNLNTDKPDLIMIDGGKGQLSAVVAVLEEMGILSQLTVISLAKQREEIFLPGASLPLTTDKEQPGVQLLRRLRDEAHRFAVTFHRQQRSKRMTKSRLDEIPNLGQNRQKILLEHFHSVEHISIATTEQLADIPGIGPKLAHKIHQHFHQFSEK